jgi:hypothetical protein
MQTFIHIIILRINWICMANVKILQFQVLLLLFYPEELNSCKHWKYLTGFKLLLQKEQIIILCPSFWNLNNYLFHTCSQLNLIRVKSFKPLK